jgi:hypothetical protein
VRNFKSFREGVASGLIKCDVTLGVIPGQPHLKGKRGLRILHSLSAEPGRREGGELHGCKLCLFVFWVFWVFFCLSTPERFY